MKYGLPVYDFVNTDEGTFSKKYGLPCRPLHIISYINYDIIFIYRFAPVIEEKVRKRLEQVKIELIVSSTDDILRIRLFWSIYSILNYWIILYIILVIISLKKNKLRNNSITDPFHIPANSSSRCPQL